MSESYPRSVRLRTREEFRDTFNATRLEFSTETGRGFLYYKESKQSRFGVTISKKVSKSAVVRNRIKRLSREFFRKNRPQLEVGTYVIRWLGLKSPSSTPDFGKTFRKFFSQKITARR